MRQRLIAIIGAAVAALTLLLGLSAAPMGSVADYASAAKPTTKKPHPHATRSSTPPPTTPPPTSNPPSTCTNPVFVTSDRNGGWTFPDGYYVHNNLWNAPSGSSTLYACSAQSWFVDMGPYAGTAVKAYPNVHLDITGSCCGGLPWSNYSSVSSKFAGVGPGTGIYNVAYDLWLNGVGWGGGSTEVMVWTENHGQRPAGNPVTTFNAPDGLAYEVWRYYDGDANVVSYVSPTTQTAGTVDLKAFVDFGIGRGLIPSNPSVHQIGYGIEICDTAGGVARFTVSDFSVTLA